MQVILHINIVDRILLTIFISVLLSGCGNKYPWTGEWIMEDNTNGIYELTDNGLIVMSYSSQDGSFSLKGKWTEVPGKHNMIKFIFDINTLECDIDNIFSKYIAINMIYDFASIDWFLQLSKDGKRLENIKNSSKYYIKVSEGSGKYDDIDPDDIIYIQTNQSNIKESVDTAAWDTTASVVEETEEIVEAEPIDTEPDFKMSHETEMFVGNIGPYPIKMRLEYDDNHGADNTESYQINIYGKYTYTRNGSTFELNGVESPVYGITLSEFTKSGNNTGDFDLQRNDEGDRLNGTFTNLTNGKQFTVKLKKVN